MDTTQLIAACGGADLLSQRLRDIGATGYSQHACAKWRIRGLPDSYSLRIALVRIIDGVPLDSASKEAAISLVRQVQA
mgnify:CR=1 FL=1